LLVLQDRRHGTLPARADPRHHPLRLLCRGHVAGGGRAMSRRLQEVTRGVKVKEREMYKRILVGVGDSAAANRALWEAIRLAREQRAQLRLVHVITWPIIPPPRGVPRGGGVAVHVYRVPAGRTGAPRAGSLPGAGGRPGPRNVRGGEWGPLDQPGNGRGGQALACRSHRAGDSWAAWAPPSGPGQ